MRSIENPATMQKGAFFPTREIGTDPDAISLYAQEAEKMGFAFLLFYDHIILPETPDKTAIAGNNQYNAGLPFHEPFTLMSFLAACTEKINLIPGVLVLPLRQTPLVAKQAAEVDLLSRQRLQLGIGAGYNQPEFTAMGIDFNTRFHRFEEQIHLLRLLWENPIVTFHGNYHTVDHAGINPRPERSIPLWMGGWGPKTLSRIAKLADGWMPHKHPDEIGDQLTVLRERLQENGENPMEFPVMGGFGRKEYKSPADWMKTVEEWEKLQVRFIAFSTMGRGFSHVDQHLEELRSFQTIFDHRDNDSSPT